MTEACPIPTDTERACGAILGAIEDDLRRDIDAALANAAQRARSEIAVVSLDLPPPAGDYFAAMVHQHLYCRLCGADPKTLAGGRAEIAMALIRNSQNIARHYWGAKIETRSKP